MDPHKWTPHTRNRRWWLNPNNNEVASWTNVPPYIDLGAIDNYYPDSSRLGKQAEARQQELQCRTYCSTTNAPMIMYTGGTPTHINILDQAY